jgi:hypothetical protein
VNREENALSHVTQNPFEKLVDGEKLVVYPRQKIKVKLVA